MSWLNEHYETFVKPYMDTEDVVYNNQFIYPPRQTTSSGSQRFFTDNELTVIKNAWRSVKRACPKDKQVLLAGRDVFIFEILAQREKYRNTLFRPDISRMTVRHIAKEIPNLDDYFLFDTGFAGTIPKSLGIESFSLFSHSGNFIPETSPRTNRDTKQIFPRLTWSRGLALKIESTPKYWESARLGQAYPQIDVDDLFTDKLDVAVELTDKVIQNYSRKEEFYRAWLLTQEIYTNSAPKFIKQHKPVTPTGIWG